MSHFSTSAGARSPLILNPATEHTARCTCLGPGSRFVAENWDQLKKHMALVNHDIPIGYYHILPFYVPPSGMDMRLDKNGHFQCEPQVIH